MNSFLKGYLPSIQIGAPQEFQSLVLLPLFGSDQNDDDYFTLSEVLEQSCAVVTEVSEGGSVPNIRVQNLADRRLLLRTRINRDVSPGAFASQ